MQLLIVKMIAHRFLLSRRYSQPRVYGATTSIVTWKIAPIHRISGLGSSQHHQEATESIWNRYNNRSPFHHQLLLPFHLMADQEAQVFLQERRIRWTLDDLADFDDELKIDTWCEKSQETLTRYLSDADPQSVKFEESDDADKLVVSLALPKESAAELEAQSLEHRA